MITKEQILKIRMMTEGIKISDKARNKLTKNGNILSIFEYPTTSGIIMKISDTNIYVNAPFTKPVVVQPDLELDFDSENLFLRENNKETPVTIFPPSKGLMEYNTNGRPYYLLAMSLLDKVRFSHINGCAYRCQYCDLHELPYTKETIEDLIEAGKKAISESDIKIRHLSISGGTPKKKDFDYQDKIFKKLTQEFDLPLDIMMSPVEDISYLRNLKSYGVNGLSINSEIFDPEVARKVNPQKAGMLERGLYHSFLEEAVNVFGKKNIRSLVIVGIESLESTYKGIEELAKIGVSPVLSPFIPSGSIDLSDIPAPDVKTLISVYEKSQEITAKYNVKLGPECSMCQFNTLTFPDNSNF